MFLFGVSGLSRLPNRIEVHKDKWLAVAPRWWTCSTARCRTVSCWQDGTWCVTSVARIATASWAGSMSSPRRTASATRRAVSFWRGRWSGRARASRSMSPLTIPEFDPPTHRHRRSDPHTLRNHCHLAQLPQPHCSILLPLPSFFTISWPNRDSDWSQPSSSLTCIQAPAPRTCVCVRYHYQTRSCTLRPPLRNWLYAQHAHALKVTRCSWQIREHDLHIDLHWCPAVFVWHRHCVYTYFVLQPLLDSMMKWGTCDSVGCFVFILAFFPPCSSCPQCCGDYEPVLFLQPFDPRSCCALWYCFDAESVRCVWKGFGDKVTFTRMCERAAPDKCDESELACAVI